MSTGSVGARQTNSSAARRGLRRGRPGRLRQLAQAADGVGPTVHLHRHDAAFDHAHKRPRQRRHCGRTRWSGVAGSTRSNRCGAACQSGRDVDDGARRPVVAQTLEFRAEAFRGHGRATSQPADAAASGPPPRRARPPRPPCGAPRGCPSPPPAAPPARPTPAPRATSPRAHSRGPREKCCEKRWGTRGKCRGKSGNVEYSICAACAL
jgi:hypothetical protein